MVNDKPEYQGTIPVIPTALMEYLEANYPPFIPQATETREEIMVRAGAATLVQSLRAHHDAQHNINSET